MELRGLVDPDGVSTLDAGHPDDLAAKVERALELMVGEDEAPRVMEAAGGDPHQVQASLRKYLEREFFRWHVRLYRKRPVYWLLQSPRRLYGFYLFHERITRDTLFLLAGNRYLGGKHNRVRADLADLAQRIQAAPRGAERRRLEKERDSKEALLLDLEAFARNVAEVTSRANERGEIAGWAPELDDGVLLNLAPIHSLIPAWSAEPKKAWEALARGDYDWSHTAMRYWPDRVLEACRRNKSYAIAHDRLDVYDDQSGPAHGARIANHPGPDRSEGGK